MSPQIAETLQDIANVGTIVTTFLVVKQAITDYMDHKGPPGATPPTVRKHETRLHRSAHRQRSGAASAQRLAYAA